DLGKHHDEMIKKLESWPMRKGRYLPHKTAKFATAPVRVARRKELTNIRFVLPITLNREFSDLEADAIGALNHVLTGTFHSRIWGKARSRGICYGMGSSINRDIEGTTMWEFSGQVAL